MTRLDPDVEAALRRGKRQLLDAYGDDPNVTGAGVGFRFRGGQWTDEPVVTVMVAKKRTEALISRARLLPKTVEVDGKSWGVDVVQAGPFVLHHPPAQQATARDAVADHPLPRDARRERMAEEARDKLTGGGFKSLTGKVRPPREGCSISNYDETVADGKVAGTLGCFVKDPTDNTICLLSCNHVIGLLNQGKVGDPIIQPGGLDGGVKLSNAIAKLKRFSPLGDGTEVDAAIAQLDSQSEYTIEVMNDLMPPISATHPAVGMVVAGDSNGITSLLTRMDATLASVNVELLGSTPPHGGAGSSSELQAPEIGMNLEKVGRTTGYTSATVLVLGVDAQVNTGGPLGIIEYQDLAWVMFFSLPGDSGSVACRGGSGNLEEVLLFLALLAEDDLLGAIGDYYDVPLNTSANNQLADDLRDNFLAQSKTGQLLIDATYVNSQVVIDRLQKDTGSAHLQSSQQKHAKELWSKYYDLAAKLITSKSPTAVVTSSELKVVSSIMSGLGQCSMYSKNESQAAALLYRSVVKPTQGMNRTQLLNYMNKQSVFSAVHHGIISAGTLEIPGPVSLYDRDGE
jgi:hypothetical protein